MKKFTIITFSLLICSIYCRAQSIPIKEILISENGIPIFAYNLVLEGTNIGTQSNLCGEFELNIPEDFNGNVIISTITPREWQVKSKKLKHQPFCTIILKEHKEHTNRNCDKKVRKKNVIRIK